MKLKVLFSLFLLSLLTACGDGGLKVESLAQEADNKTGEFSQLEIESKSQIDSLNQELLELQKINFSDIENTSLSLSEIRKIENKLSGKIKNISDLIEGFKTRLNDLKQRISNAIALLDPNNPSQAATIEKLEKLLDRISQIETNLDRIKDLFTNIRSVIDRVFDKIFSRLDPSNPIHTLIRMVLEEIKNRLINSIRI